MTKLFKPLTYSIQNGEPIIEGYTMEKPIESVVPTYYDLELWQKWQQSKVAVKVDESIDYFILDYFDGGESFVWKNRSNKPINIDFLADRIEVREERILLAKSGGYKDFGEIIPPTIIEGKPYKVTYTAFLLSEKKEECKCFRLGEGSPWQTYNCEIHNENIEELQSILKPKLYSIEQIEKAIEETMPHKYSMAWDNERFKKLFLTNLTKL